MNELVPIKKEVAITKQQSHSYDLALSSEHANALIESFERLSVESRNVITLIGGLEKLTQLTQEGINAKELVNLFLETNPGYLRQVLEALNSHKPYDSVKDLINTFGSTIYRDRNTEWPHSYKERNQSIEKILLRKDIAEGDLSNVFEDTRLKNALRDSGKDISLLRKMTQDTSYENQGHSIHALAWLGDDSLLYEMLVDSDEGVRICAANGFDYFIPFVGTEAQLKKALLGEDDYVQFKVLRSATKSHRYGLADYNAPDIRNIVSNLLDSQEVAVRIDAAYFLAAVGDVAAIPKIERLISIAETREYGMYQLKADYEQRHFLNALESLGHGRKLLGESRLLSKWDSFGGSSKHVLRG